MNRRKLRDQALWQEALRLARKDLDLHRRWVRYHENLTSEFSDRINLIKREAYEKGIELK